MRCFWCVALFVYSRHLVLHLHSAVQLLRNGLYNKMTRQLCLKLLTALLTCDVIFVPKCLTACLVLVDIWGLIRANDHFPVICARIKQVRKLCYRSIFFAFIILISTEIVSNTQILRTNYLQLYLNHVNSRWLVINLMHNQILLFSSL